MSAHLPSPCLAHCPVQERITMPCLLADAYRMQQGMIALHVGDGMTIGFGTWARQQAVIAYIDSQNGWISDTDRYVRPACICMSHIPGFTVPFRTTQAGGACDNCWNAVPACRCQSQRKHKMCSQYMLLVRWSTWPQTTVLL